MQERLKKVIYSIIGGLLMLFFLLLALLYVYPPLGEKIGIKDFAPPFKLGLDIQGGAHLVYETDMSHIEEKDRTEALEGVRDVVEKRVNAFGVSEPLVQTSKGNDHYRLIVELAGVFDIKQAISAIGETPILEFKLPTKDVQVELSEEQEKEVEKAQKEERERAVEVLSQTKDNSDFSALAKQYSVDEETKDNGGYIGFIEEDDSVFDGLIAEIKKKKYKTGIVPGLYESTSAIHVVDFRSTKEIEEVQMSHILICYKEAEKCKSERTKVEAEILAKELQEKVTKISFPDIAQEQSDDSGSASNGGSLGWVREGMMVESFQNAYKALKDSQLSDIIESQFGYHIIHREDTRTVQQYELAHIEMPWTTPSDIAKVNPWENTLLSGKHIQRASVAFDQNTNQPYIALEFNKEGGELFGEITEKNVGQIMGIFLDGYPISTPQIQQAIYGGSASIVGNFTVLEAKDLVRRLNAGALPVPIKLIGQQTVGPTLGQVSLQKSIDSAFIGFLLVGLFMILYYRLPGILSVFALFIYALLNLAVYKLFGITMTLSGIAGFILSIGMAVDANVLIFERLKEELASGRDLRTAIDEGFRRAWTSIRDGNATTLVATLILFTFSTSFIKGFALTLGIGILLSMLTAITVTRYSLYFVSHFSSLRKDRLYGVKK